MLKMINKTNCWLSAVFVDFQFTPWRKTEVYFNGLVQQCPACLETVRTPMQFLSSFFRECLDELANFIVRLIYRSIVIPSYPIRDADTFTYAPSSIQLSVVTRTPILRAVGGSTIQKCNTCDEYISQRFPCPSCFEFQQRFKKSSKCFDRRTARARCPRCDPEAEAVFFFSICLFVLFFILF